MDNSLLLRDIEQAIDECLKPDYFGNVSVKINICDGKIRVVKFSKEEDRKY